jgi:hypothetical protein
MFTALFKKTAPLFFVLMAFSATAQQATFAKKIRPSGAGGNTQVGFCVNADNSMTIRMVFQDSLTTLDEPFLANYDSTGALRWHYYMDASQLPYLDYNTTIHAIPGGHIECTRGLYNNTGYRKIITRTNAAGIPLWSKTYFTPLFEDLNNIRARQLADGSFMVVSNLRNTSFFERSTHVMRIDSTGNISWSNRYHPEPDFSAGYSNITLAHNQDLLVIGTATVTNFVTGSRVMRIDSSGNLRWSKIIHYNALFDGADIAEIPGDSIWILSRYSDPQGLSHIALTKMDSAGQLVLSRGYHIPGVYLNPRGILTTPDGGLITYGMHTAPAAADKAFLMRTDASGGITWFYSYTGIDLLQAEKTTSGGIVYSGYPAPDITSLITGRKAISGLDACDSVQQVFPVLSALYPGSVNDTGYVPLQLTVNGFTYTPVAVPFYESPLCGLYNPNAVAETAQPDQVQVFPNPAQNRLTIRGISGNTAVRLYNSNGQSCLQQTTTGNELQIDLSSFAEGLYFVTIDNGKKRSTQKVIIQQ